MSGMGSRSAAVITACTPGRTRAAAASILRPRPRRNRKSSIRSTGLPTRRLVVLTCSITGSFRVEPDAGELPLGELLHGVAHALAAEPARADAAERISIEAEA